MSLYYFDKSPHLELLPPELQCQILKSVPNLKSLRALLRASPHCFRVYRTSRETVLSHVASNQITPAILPIALHALERRDHRRLMSNRTKAVASQKTPRKPHKISFETWERLLCFHEIVESFVSNFASSRLVALENSIHSQTQSPPPHESPERHLELSQIEYARLARAFYHLDLYGNLFYDVNTYGLRDDKAQIRKLARSVLFLQSLRAWELEELLCVRSYMIDRLKGYLNQLEDDFMKAFLENMPYIMWPNEDDEDGDELVNSPDVFFSHMGYMWYQYTWIENCLTRGLETLSEMFSADTFRGKFALLGYWDWDHQLGDYFPPFMSQTLNAMPASSEWGLAAKAESPEIGFHENIEGPNEAWSWALKFCAHPNMLFDQRNPGTRARTATDNHPLEGWGYVIWDHERLKRLGILTRRQDPRPLIMLKPFD